MVWGRSQGNTHPRRPCSFVLPRCSIKKGLVVVVPREIARDLSLLVLGGVSVGSPWRPGGRCVARYRSPDESQPPPHLRSALIPSEDGGDLVRRQGGLMGRQASEGVRVLAPDSVPPSFPSFAMKLGLGTVRPQLEHLRVSPPVSQQVGGGGPEGRVLGPGSTSEQEPLETLHHIGAVGANAQLHVPPGHAEGPDRRPKLRPGNGLLIPRQRPRSDAQRGRCALA